MKGRRPGWRSLGAGLAVCAAGFVAYTLGLREPHVDSRSITAPAIPGARASVTVTPVPLPPSATTAALDWRSLEEQEDLYAAFQSARASGTPESLHEAADILQACVMGTFPKATLDIQQHAELATRDGDERRYRWAQQSRAASERLVPRCRGFGVVRDYREMRLELLAEASRGTGPVAELLRLSDLERRSYELTPEVRPVVGAALRSGGKAAVTLALGALMHQLAELERGSAAQPAYDPRDALMLAARQAFGIEMTFHQDTSMRKDAVCAAGACVEMLEASLPQDQPAPSPELVASFGAASARVADALRAGDVDAVLREAQSPLASAPQP